ncbi:hypothetical protein P280DRAFT_87755 [Massarina eburnea CBS 473.64]|uniref:Uncharacterized protein n=1 Tax=Massarina eburnea CBS 473.64 TaxID=1395130 RepID=A0A6A6RQU9_9PLEO|nr:hypothetical protein P280DRAFT_87755 [Massarina eburnea CBS 473.64]
MCICDVNSTCLPARSLLPFTPLRLPHGLRDTAAAESLLNPRATTPPFPNHYPFSDPSTHTSLTAPRIFLHRGAGVSAIVIGPVMGQLALAYRFLFCYWSLPAPFQRGRV